MKNFRAIAYERSGPVSDMFVPRAVRITAPEHFPHRATKVVVAALFLAAIPALFLPGGTLSYFSDEEQSTGNTFAAGPLDITVTPDHTSATLIINQTGETFVITPVATPGSLPFRYKVSGAASGNATFCSAVTASGSAPLSYSGPINAFTTSDTATLSPWSLTLTLNGTSPPIIDGQQCILDLTYEVYQEGGAVGTEYHDTEHVTLLLTADPPVVTSVPVQNDVLPVPPVATSTDATSTDPVPPPAPSGDNSPPPIDTSSSTSPTEDVTQPAPENILPPADVPPPGSEIVIPPIDTLPPPASTSTEVSI